MLFQQNDNGSDKDKGKERRVELVVAGKDPAKPFDFLKETFNQMALLIGMPIHRPRDVAVALWRDRVGSVLGNDVRTDRFGIVRFVTKYVVALDINLAEQRDCMLGIMVVPSAEQK